MLLVTTGAVGASTAILPILPTIGGNGTILFQVVVLGAWGIIASLTSGEYADLNHGPVWLVALLLNLLLFLVPALVIWLITRNHWPLTSTISLAVWCLFYLSALFVLFPATDWP
jgi:hypothetical protein